MSTVKLCDVCKHEITPQHLHPPKEFTLKGTTKTPSIKVDICWMCWDKVEQHIRTMMRENNEQRIRLLAGKTAVPTEEEIQAEKAKFEEYHRKREEERQRKMAPFRAHCSKLPPNIIAKLIRSGASKSKTEDLLYKQVVPTTYRLKLNDSVRIKMPQVPLTKHTERMAFAFDVQGDENVTIDLGETPESLLLPENILCYACGSGKSIIKVSAINSSDVIPLTIEVYVA